MAFMWHNRVMLAVRHAATAWFGVRQAYVYPCTATVLLARYNTAMENEVRKSGDALRVVFQNTWSKANLEEDWVKYEALLAAEVSRAGNFSSLLPL